MTKKQPTSLREAKIVETPEENTTDVYIPDDSMLLPNEGGTFDSDQEEEIEQEKTEDQKLFSDGTSLINALMDWLESEEKDCDSIAAAMLIRDKYKCSADEALIALDVCRNVFMAKRVSLLNIRDTVDK
jgi:hypothetical protein